MQGAKGCSGGGHSHHHPCSATAFHWQPQRQPPLVLLKLSLHANRLGCCRPSCAALCWLPAAPGCWPPCLDVPLSVAVLPSSVSSSFFSFWVGGKKACRAHGGNTGCGGLHQQAKLMHLPQSCHHHCDMPEGRRQMAVGAVPWPSPLILHTLDGHLQGAGACKRRGQVGQGV